MFFFSYHLDKLITRIDEIKFTEKIVVDQKHDLTTRRLVTSCWDESLDDDGELFINKLDKDDESDVLSIDNGSLLE
jgi:hypothetical protein